MRGEKQCKSISSNILDAITFLPDNTDFFRWCNTKIKSFFSCIIYFIKRVFTWDPKWNLPEIKFQPTIKGIPFTLLFIAGEMKWISFRGWSEINGPFTKSQSFLLTHSQMFLLYDFISGVVYRIFYHPKWTFIFVKMTAMK